MSNHSIDSLTNNFLQVLVAKVLVYMHLFGQIIATSQDLGPQNGGEK